MSEDFGTTQNSYIYEPTIPNYHWWYPYYPYQPYQPTTTTTTTMKLQTKCQYGCGADDLHAVTVCPRVRRVSFHENGKVSEILFETEGDY